MSATCSYHLSMAQASHRNWSTYGSMASFYRRWSSRGKVFPLNLKTMSLSGCQTTSSQSKCKPSGDVHSWNGSVQSGFYGTAVRNGSTSLFFFLLVYILLWQNLVWRAFHLPEFLDWVFEPFTERERKKIRLLLCLAFREWGSSEQINLRSLLMYADCVLFFFSVSSSGCMWLVFIYCVNPL